MAKHIIVKKRPTIKLINYLQLYSTDFFGLKPAPFMALSGGSDKLTQPHANSVFSSAFELSAQAELMLGD